MTDAHRKFYEDNGYIKRRKTGDERAQRVRMALYGSQYYQRGGPAKFAVGSKVTRFLKDVTNKYGKSQGERLQQAADLTDLSRISREGLEQMGSPKGGLFTMLPPGDFERYARPIDPKWTRQTPYTRWSEVPNTKLRPGEQTYDAYLDNLEKLARTKGLPESPRLWLGQGHGPVQTDLPNIAGHEGRHRMRMLDRAGEDNALVRLLPANEGELRGAPDEVVERMMQKYFPTGGQQDWFRPEGHPIIQRAPVDFPNIPFGEGSTKLMRELARGLGKLRAKGSGYEAPPGKPSSVKIPGLGDVEARPLPEATEAAEAYMRARGAKYDPNTFVPLNEDYARRVAQAYDKMPNAPHDPRVRNAYTALIDETMDQYRSLKDAGYDFKFHKPGMADPYARSPSMGYEDLVNRGRLWVFPTEAGYGSGVGDSSLNPLLKRVGRVGDLDNATANDAFRVVHDMYGHFGPGNPFFRAPGEERAFQLHSRMYGPEARQAAATETRGQNSWVNFGPFAEKNKLASGADTIYAPQTVNLLPPWAMEMPPTKAHGGAVDRLMGMLPEKHGLVGRVAKDLRGWRTRTAERLAKEGEELNAGRDIKLPFVSPDVNTRLQTVRDPSRIMFPGIYKDIPDLMAEARAKWTADPGKAGPMYQLFGHTRESLDDLAQSNRFLQSIEPPQPPWSAPARARGANVSEQILTDRNARRVQDVIGEALQDPQLRTTRSWYEMSPMYDWMTQQGLGLPVQRGLNTRMGVMSPGSNPVTEINRGFHAHYLAPQGRWEDLSKYGALPVDKRPLDFPEDLYGLKPHPYMNTAAMPNLRSFETTGELSSPKHKVPTYIQASDPVWANARRPVADAHFTRFLGYPDVRGANQTAGLRKELSGSEYGDLLPWWSKKVANPLGIDERDAQALMWNVGGPQTGVSYIGQPKLEMISNYIQQAAERHGLPLDQAAYELLSGQRPFDEGGHVDDDDLRYHTSQWQEPWA